MKMMQNTNTWTGTPPSSYWFSYVILCDNAFRIRHFGVANHYLWPILVSVFPSRNSLVSWYRRNSIILLLKNVGFQSRVGVRIPWWVQVRSEIDTLTQGRRKVFKFGEGGNLTRLIVLTFSSLPPDSRTADWLFVSTPWSTLALVSLYLLIVMLGPQVMKKREAFQINRLLVVYNFGLVLLSLYMFSEVCGTSYTTI